MDNYLIIGILAVIIGFAVGYLLRAKKRGQQCIGCPHSKNCSGHCNSK